jgi:hypothetical protein
VFTPPLGNQVVVLVLVFRFVGLIGLVLGLIFVVGLVFTVVGVVGPATRVRTRITPRIIALVGTLVIVRRVESGAFVGNSVAVSVGLAFNHAARICASIKQVCDGCHEAGVEFSGVKLLGDSQNELG